MQRDRIVYLLFDISVISKGIDGALEIVGGVLLFLISPTQVYAIVRVLTQHELSEDPHDLVATYLLNSTQRLSGGAQVFGAPALARSRQSGVSHRFAAEAALGIPCGYPVLPALPGLSAVSPLAHPLA